MFRKSMSDLLFVLQIVIETSFFSYWDIHKLMQDFVKGSLNNFTDCRGPAWTSRISNQAAQSSNQVTTGQCFSANDVPDMYYNILYNVFSNFVSKQKITEYLSSAQYLTLQ